ncbi:hypothetical protein ACWWI0_002432 [Cronobacter sakazakii]|uniref:hypothetical protein n=1 Tax=Cronobacter sakazakii TaxID=28141 RepID=UPI00158812F2|nr:hypothetical protein [Cronobacter sakazakii]ELY2668028.1 hypothetical protein [Cronobacter sakazakii]ELY3801807.1 hypothetical protein [Cronobacter sakazakii]ELY4371340.1 hypothetical protein [Cronobacter sakazakii]NUW63069.1 hypothetical protein [Cronobacter sakazakii]
MNMMLKFMLSQYAQLPIPQDILHSWLEKWIYEQEKYCVDTTFSARFPWKETGLPQEYFLQRKLNIDGHQFLTGPRYRGGDINNPFIDIVASDSNIDCSVLKSVCQEWEQLKPQYIRILTPGHEESQGITDQFIYASWLSGASEYPDDSVTLRLAEYVDFEWCRRALMDAYQYSLLAIPALRGNLCPVDEEELSNHISEGNAHIVYQEGIRVGLIICERGDVAFLRGYRISEEVIVPAFRGRSLASFAQRLLCNSLYHSSREPILLTGTIIPENLPSIKTAVKAGRTCILRYEFLPVMFS